jgi:vesicle coat complex subunit
LALDRYIQIRSIGRLTVYILLSLSSMTTGIRMQSFLASCLLWEKHPEVVLKIKEIKPKCILRHQNYMFKNYCLKRMDNFLNHISFHAVLFFSSREEWKWGRHCV